MDFIGVIIEIFSPLLVFMALVSGFIMGILYLSPAKVEESFFYHQMIIVIGFFATAWVVRRVETGSSSETRPELWLAMFATYAIYIIGSFLGTKIGKILRRRIERG